MLRFAEEGAQLVVADLTAETAESVAAEATEVGAVAHALTLDVTDVGSASERLATAAELMGGLDILINNAGVLRPPGTEPGDVSELAWDFVVDTNLKGLWFLSEATAHLLGQEVTAIVNVASDAGLRGARNPYEISKWGVVGYTRGLARRLAPNGVRVNAVAPGPVATSMMGCPDGSPRENPKQPLGRYSFPEEVAEVVLFLASKRASAVTGQIVGVNTDEY